MKNAITDLKTELKQTIFLGNIKSELAPIPTHGGSRFSRFVCTFVGTILVLSLYVSCLLDRLCPTPALGAAPLVPAASLCNFLTIKGAPRRRAEGARVSLGSHWATLHLSPPHTLQAPSRTQSVLSRPLYRFLFVHKVSVSPACAPES